MDVDWFVKTIFCVESCYHCLVVMFAELGEEGVARDRAEQDKDECEKYQNSWDSEQNARDDVGFD